MKTHRELKFFNALSGTLKIELTVPAEPIADLDNLRAAPDAEVVRLELLAEVYDRKSDAFRAITDEEYESVAFRGASIRLQSEDGDAVSHDAPNGSFFTVRQLLEAVEKTERQTRSQTDWLGGIDVHHVFFEGIHSEDGEVWEIDWGS